MGDDGMIKIGMTSKGVNEQIAVLEHFPDLAEKHYRPVVSRDVKTLQSRIRPDIPRMSGRAASTFGSKVTGKGFRIKGQVGWYDKSDPWYPNVLEYGARPHSLSKGSSVRSKSAFSAFKSLITGDFSAQQKGALGSTHVLIKGAWKTIKRHPGMSARGFMMAGYSSIQPIIEADLAQANERIIADLAAIGSKS